MWWIPRTQKSHTVTVMIMTPPHSGSVPLDKAERQEAPEMELTAFHPVVDIRLKITQIRLPQ